MFGLAVRWPLAEATPQIEQDLHDYVADESYEKFAGLANLHQKTWRMRSGEYFEGIYVFNSSDARESFQADFTPRVAESKVSQIIGTGPEAIEPFEILALVEGPSGFRAAPRFEA